jgi:phage baseplate assembly protein W
MTSPLHRTFRFVLARGQAEEAPGFRFAASGGLAMVEEDASVRQAILLLISTRPGERLMRPGYGCDLDRLVFSPNDGTTAGLAVHYVRRALETWEPRIDLVRIDAGRSPEDASRLEITVDYRVRATQRRDSVTTRLSLDGGAP